MLPGLNDLFHPLGAKRFLRDYWQRRHYVARARPELASLISKELDGLQIDRLLKRHRGPVQAWFGGVDGAFHGVNATAEVAAAAYKAGTTIFLPDVRTLKLARWQARLARELGHPGEVLTCSLFAARRGAGSRAHFDALENFTVQLSGVKRWRIARNDHVDAPIDNWATSENIPRSLRLYCDAPLPTEMSRSATTVELRPGDVLYLPRGAWHSAEASADSFSLFLGFPLVPCVDLVLGALRARLVRRTLWRKNVIDASAGPAWEKAARHQLDECLHALEEELAGLTVDGVLGAPSRARLGDLTLLARNPNATIELMTPGDAAPTALVVLHLGGFSKQYMIPVGAPLVRLSRWLIARPGRFSLADVLARAGALPRDEVRMLVHTLWQVGALVTEAGAQARRV